MEEVFILCAGDSKRWSWENTPKFFVPVFGDKLLPRTIKQVSRYDYTPMVVTHRTDVSSRLEGSCGFIDPESRLYTCDTLYSTSKFWEDRTIVLLGDVLYSNSVMNKIISHKEDIIFYGNIREREIYALTFTDRSRILKGIQEVDERVRDGHHGQLWQLFYSINKFGPETFPTWIPYKNGMFSHVEDFTQDFDSVEEYEKFLKSGFYKDDLAAIK